MEQRSCDMVNAVAATELVKSPASKLRAIVADQWNRWSESGKYFSQDANEIICLPVKI